MTGRWIGSKIDGTVLGVPVYGWWTGRGIQVLAVLDNKPLDVAYNAWKGENVEGRFTRLEQWIEIGGEYLLDD